MDSLITAKARTRLRWLVRPGVVSGGAGRRARNPPGSWRPHQCRQDDLTRRNSASEIRRNLLDIPLHSDELFPEITAHPSPTDLDAVRVLAPAPAVLDLFLWLSYRCFLAKGAESIPIFIYSDLRRFRPRRSARNVEHARRFREKLEQWLKTIAPCGRSVQDESMTSELI